MRQWSEDEDDFLRKSQNLSARQVGMALGRSRNSVLGRRRRLFEPQKYKADCEKDKSRRAHEKQQRAVWRPLLPTILDRRAKPLAAPLPSMFLREKRYPNEGEV